MPEDVTVLDNIQLVTLLNMKESIRKWKESQVFNKVFFYNTINK